MNTKSNRLAWSDFLRVVATFAVVLLHASGATLGSEAVDGARFWWLNWMDGGTRWCVPVFVMLSGMFFLDPEKELPAKKLARHGLRILTALLFWAVFYAAWDAKSLVEGLRRVVVGQTHYHLWYLPMILGLYLLTPLYRALVKGASRRTLWYAVSLWAAATVTLGALYQFFPGGYGHTWLQRLELWPVMGYSGYYLLGYLLKTAEIKPKTAYIMYVFGILGLVFTVAGTRSLSVQGGAFEARLYGYLTPNVAASAVALFVFAKRWKWAGLPLYSALARYTFGVYLAHPFVLNLFNSLGFPSVYWHVGWAIPLQAALVFVIAFAVSWLLNHIPKVGKFIA